MRGFYNIALTLLIIGGLNWGLIGFFDYNLVESLFGTMPWLTRIIYALVGASAIVSFGLYARTTEKSR